jgi:hypothetical protein
MDGQPHKEARRLIDSQIGRQVGSLIDVDTFCLKVIDDIDWFRPHDFVRPDDPILISDRNEGFDIK